MRYLIYKSKRIVFTFFSKFIAEIAVLTKWNWTPAVLNFFLKKRAEELARESVAYMNKTKKWQKKAEKCIAEYHNFELYMKNISKSQPS